MSKLHLTVRSADELVARLKDTMVGHTFQLAETKDRQAPTTVRLRGYSVERGEFNSDLGDCIILSFTDFVDNIRTFYLAINPIVKITLEFTEKNVAIVHDGQSTLVSRVFTRV